MSSSMIPANAEILAAHACSSVPLVEQVIAPRLGEIFDATGDDPRPGPEMFALEVEEGGVGEPTRQDIVK